MIALLTGISGAWAIDVKIATFGQPVTKNGAWVSNYEFSTNSFSGLAGVTITAPNSDFNIGYTTDATYGDGWVNDGYGYCLRLVTSDKNAHTVSLNAPSGYKIVGYSFFARSNSGSYNHVLTPAGGSSITSTTSGVWVTVKEILTASATFTIQTQNAGNTLYIPQFTISLVADTKKVVDTKVTADKENPIAFSNIDDIANGTTPVVLYNNGRGTYQFANPYDGILGGYTSSVGIINTSSVKFLVEKSGDNYKIINVDSRKYIPAASSNVTMLPSTVSGAPTFTITDKDGSTYAIKSGESAFNGNNGNYGSFVYWGSGTDANSSYKIMPIASEEAIEYTIPDKFYATTAYYRIKAAGRGDYYLSAGSSDTYIKLTQDAFDHSGTQVWKTYLGSRGVKLYSMGVNKYVAFNTNRSVQGQNISAFTDSEQAGYNFIPEDKGDGNYAFQALAPLGNTYLSNNGGVSATLSMGYYTNYDAGAQLQFERVYRVTLQSDMGDILGYVYTDGSIAASDLYDYDYYISGVAKTKSEVVEAINAVTDDNLVVVCSHQRSATITSKAEIDPTKVYSLTTARGWLYAKDADYTVKTFASSETYITYDENNQWAFVTVDEGDTYYLYNVGKKRFLMSCFGTGNFMDDKFTIRPVTINTTGNATYPLSFKDGSSTYNVTSGNLTIDSWSTADDGNRYSVQAIENINFDPSEAKAMLNAMSSNVPFDVSPAPSAGSFDVTTIWYFVSMRPGDGNGGYYAYVPDGYDYDSPTNIPLATATGTKEEEDNYRWCITGSIADGYRLFNKAAGADKVFVFDDGGKIKAYSGNESASLFYLAKANNPSSIAAPSFVFASTTHRPNRQSNAIASWANSDTGSEFGFTFDIEYADNNFYAEYEVLVKPYMDAPVSSNYFCLTNDIQKTNIWNLPERYSDGIEHGYYSSADVTAMWNGLVAYLKKPIPTMGMRLKNNNSGKYVSYGAAAYNGDGLICNETFAIAEADVTSVMQFQNTTGMNYKIFFPAKGKYVGSQTEGDTPFPLVNEADAAEFTIVPLSPGVIALYDENSYTSATYPGYLHAAGWTVPGVVNYQLSSLSSHWNVEEAGSLCFNMIDPEGVTDGDDVYMSYANNLGLPLNAPDEVSVYIISSQDSEKAYITEVDSKDIPAGSGVILKAEKGSTVRMNIKTSTAETLDGNILRAGDGTTNVAAGNYMLAYNSTDEMAKFYAIGEGGFVVPANKAYLPAMGAGVKALTLFFGGDVVGINTIDNGQLVDSKEIYNLAGQRLNRVQKGVNIINGKKVIVK